MECGAKPARHRLNAAEISQCASIVPDACTGTGVPCRRSAAAWYHRRWGLLAGTSADVRCAVSRGGVVRLVWCLVGEPRRTAGHGDEDQLASPAGRCRPARTRQRWPWRRPRRFDNRGAAAEVPSAAGGCGRRPTRRSRQREMPGRAEPVPAKANNPPPAQRTACARIYREARTRRHLSR